MEQVCGLGLVIVLEKCANSVHLCVFVCGSHDADDLWHNDLCFHLRAGVNINCFEFHL